MQTLRQCATAIVQRLQQAGFEAYWVGGCVRDQLLGREPEDYDIVSSAIPEQVEALFARTVPVGRQFGIVVVVENEHQFQVATFRSESGYQDGRRPERVRFADAKADALRRDFTVNGMFYDPVRGRLHDWVEGSADLQRKVIRTIGEPAERFAEDHLRLLRAVRFAAQLGFEIEGRTFAAVQEGAARIGVISAERVREELCKLFKPPHAARGLELLRHSRLLDEVLPELSATVHCHQSPEFHPEGTVFSHILSMLRQMPPVADTSLPWAVLLHDVAKPVTTSTDSEGGIHFYEHERIGAVIAEAILDRLRFPRKQVTEIVQAVRYHMQFKDATQMRKATLRRMLMRPTFPLELELHRLDCLGSHGALDSYEYLVNAGRELASQPQIRPPLVTGDDLIALGIAPGPAMGALLARIREMQLQDELKSREEALDWVRQQ